MRPLPSLVLLLTAAFAARGADDFARYQIILDKLPFGKPPEKPIAPPIVTAVDTYAWINDYRMTFITQTADNKAKVGLQNIKDQTTLSVESGETHAATGIQLMSVSYDEKTATLIKGGQTHSIKLQDPATAPVAGAPGGINPGGPGGRTPPGMPSNRGGPFGARPPRPNNTPPAPVPVPAAPENTPPRLTGAELEKHLQEYQVEVLRKGLPPLPVQLTPENDAKLVTEGVLPSLDAPAVDPNAPAAPAGPGP